MTGWSPAAGIEGKAVLVTGAAGGIGSAVAAAFATAGARVAVHDLHDDPVAEVLAGLDGEGHIAFAGDLRDPAEPARSSTPRARRWGGSTRSSTSPP